MKKILNIKSNFQPTHLWILLNISTCFWAAFFISFFFAKFAFSSRSILWVCVTAIDGVGFTTPVGVVVEAVDVAVLIVARQDDMVWVVVETVELSEDFWLFGVGWAIGGSGGKGWK
jgi:hypothetical protein